MRSLLPLLFLLPVAPAIADNSLPDVHEIVAKVAAAAGDGTITVYGLYDYKAGDSRGTLPGCYLPSGEAAQLPLNADQPALRQAINDSRPFADYIFATEPQPFQFPHDGYASAQFVAGPTAPELVLTPVRGWSATRRFSLCTPEILVEKNAGQVALRPYLPGWICTHKVGYRRISIESGQVGFAHYNAGVYHANLDVGGRAAQFDSLEATAGDKTHTLHAENAHGTLDVTIDLTHSTGDATDPHYPGVVSLTWDGKEVADQVTYDCFRH